MHRFLLCNLLLTVAVPAQLPQLPPASRPLPPEGPRGTEVQRTATATRKLDRVLHDLPRPETGTHWACGNSWKASFARDGFTFVPSFGARAPRNFPLQVAVAAARVGGEPLPLTHDVLPERVGDRLVFDRAGLQEVYDLRLDEVEQSFVIDTALPGDVELELVFTTELAEDPQRAGLQFGNEFGRVDYSDAFLVRGDRRIPLETEFANGRARIHVPAALRDGGPLVIDPIFQVTWTNAGAQGRDLTFPDISYDHTTKRYLAVWQRQWSQTDGDVFGEYFDEFGRVVPASLAIADTTGLMAQGPRVANLNIADRFLVVMEFTDPTRFGGRTMIVGRTRDANNLRFMNTPFLVSDPALTGSAATPDIGGDPSPFLTSLGWAVVWTQSTTPQSRIARRLIAADESYATSADFLSPTTTDLCYSPQISHSNGAGQVGAPAWFVVHSSIFLGANVEVVGHTISPIGAIGGRINIAVGAPDDWYPFVSSPATDSTGTAQWYMITWERQALQPQPMAAIYNHRTATITGGPIDLTSLGVGSYWTRAESDGIRFVVAASQSVFGDVIGLSTLGWTGTQFVLHEDQQLLSGAPDFPMLVADRNCGGANTQYACVYVDSNQTPSQIAIARHEGYQPGVQLVLHTFACGGLQLVMSGLTWLGHHMDFALTGHGTDLPAIVFGVPAAAPLQLCPSCNFGLRLDQPMQIAFAATNLGIDVPANVTMVGITLAVQGLSFGTGSCFSGLRTSDMWEFTTR